MRIGLFVFCCLFLMSCEKVISVKLVDREPRIVIEANLSDKDDSLRITVSRTLGAEDPLPLRSIPNPVEDAIVTIRKNNAIPELVNHSGNGRYKGYMKTETGSTYYLEVEVEGHKYTSSCIMPPRVSIDTLFVTPSALLGQTKNLATLQFTDPPEPGNYYRFLLSTDGFDHSDIYILDDRLINGRNVTQELNNFLIETDEHYSIDRHDWVRVEARSIDASVYKYFYSMNQGTQNPGPGKTPENPATNIKGGALGYFSVHSYQLLEFVSPY